MIANPARGEFVAIAGDIVLEGLDGQRVCARQRLETALRHRERIVGEVDLLLLLVPLEHREVDDPAELEPVLVDQLELLPHLCPREARRIWRTCPDRPRRRTPRRPPSDRARRGSPPRAPGRYCWRGVRARRRRSHWGPRRALSRPWRDRRTGYSRAPAGLRSAPRHSSGRRRSAGRHREPECAQTSFFSVSSRRANSLKPDPRKCSETSCMTSGLRRSGLSEPYLRIASA